MGETMMKTFLTVLISCGLLTPTLGGAEILAMLNYESKPNESLKELKMPFGTNARREGVAVIDVDPNSDNFGNILMDIPLPNDLVAHHLFFNRDATKLYLIALGKSEIRVIDMQTSPYRVKVIDVPTCQFGEDVVFSEDNRTWYATCMGSSVVIVGDAVNDTYTKTIELPVPYPHGIAINEDIDRMLVTSTVRASDLGDPGEQITALELSTGKVIKSYKVSNKESPSGEAPVEILFVPGANPPVAYITNMFGNSLWTATWNPDAGDFEVAEAYVFDSEVASVPLELYFTNNSTRLYVTTANPGHLHAFDISNDIHKPELLKTLRTAEGAHHVGFTQDGTLAVVQNSFINLPGMSDGALTVVNLEDLSLVGQIDTFKENGWNPNSIVLLPEWNDPAGH
jgi:DNA-binding beta-propeller fold protein YncE